MPRPKAYPALLLPARAMPRRRRGDGAEDSPAMQAIWDTVCRIPRGQVSTYGAVARAAGLPGRARLTGLALKLAPQEMQVPWHRVLGAGGRIVFPTQSTLYREQTQRLRAEGVIATRGRVHASCITDLGG